ncbi:MAG TPA: fibronectin type III domain-containing protein [Polyangiaceae bacterium]|nr:fibronectin type III domain-containing protein [Polyangiaceae bacterium]
MFHSKPHRDNGRVSREPQTAAWLLLALTSSGLVCCAEDRTTPPPSRTEAPRSEKPNDANPNTTQQPDTTQQPGTTQQPDATQQPNATQAVSDYTPTSASNVLALYPGNVVGGEGPANLIDGKTATKYFVGKQQLWLRYQMTRPTLITTYELTSGDDTPARDPKDWTLEGSLDGLTWSVLDTRTNQTFNSRLVSKSYTFSNTTPYLYYRLNISANQGGEDETQLSELRMRGTLPSGTAPAAATNVVASVSGTTATVSWTKVSGANGYFVQRIGDDGQRLVELSTSATTFSDANLSPGTPYLYQVQARNDSLRAFPTPANRVLVAPAAAGLQDLTALSSLSPSDQYGTSGKEGVERLTDNVFTSKYLAKAATTWIQQRTGASSVVSQYSLTSANDFPDRNPLSWKLEGSSSGADGSWTVLDTRTDQGFVNQFQTRVFTANPAGTAYSYYRLTITANHGSGLTQLAEWRLFGKSSSTLSAPSAPTGLTATVLSSNQIKLTWTDTAGQLDSESSYVIERATNSNFTQNLVSFTTGAGSTEFRSTSLAPSQAYYFRVRAANTAGGSAWATSSATTPAAPKPPSTWTETGWYGGHDRQVTLRTVESDIALYTDPYVAPSSLDWLRPIFNQNFKFAKANYGSLSDPQLFVIAEQRGRPEDSQDLYSIGGVIYVNTPEASYRNITFAASKDWADQNELWNINALTHELGHIVESNNNGWFESPSFSAWGDSKWCEIFVWDALTHSTLLPASWLDRTLTEFNASTDDFGNYWFRDFTYPLYQGKAGNTDSSHKGSALYSRYFQLLAQYLPKLDSTYGGKQMNLGEYIHFMSGAAGVNLEAQAKKAFRWSPELELQFANAQLQFPQVFALYGGSGK